VDRRIGIAAGLVAVIATAISAPVGAEVPEEARGIRTPDWARLEGVLGTYDAPFGAESPWGRLTAMAFRVATGEALPGVIDLEATEDIPFKMAAAASGSKDGPVLLVGTQRGVVLRFALRLPDEPRR
jgi:hypothetical protein